MRPTENQTRLGRPVSRYAQAKVVVYGTLKNPRFDPKTDDGFTDLHVSAALKDDAARGNANVLTIRKYAAGGRQRRLAPRSR